MIHPSSILHEAQRQPVVLPVCDHYAGSEKLMRKSLALQAERGPVFDVTLDLEDGASVGQEAEHAQLAARLAASESNRFGRVGVRIHDVNHPAFVNDLETVMHEAGGRLAYIAVPKVNSAHEALHAADAVERLSSIVGLAKPVPVHILVETHGALREVFRIAAHPGVECLSFGLMDFVSAHRGAIPAQALTASGQFQHPLIQRAKLEISAACHAYGKTPSHNVVTELDDPRIIQQAAQRAHHELGYTRMWSIHPMQIEAIVQALSPTATEIENAARILVAAQDKQWGPIRDTEDGQGRLHDRASYRFYWDLLRRAHAAGLPLPPEALSRFFSA